MNSITSILPPVKSFQETIFLTVDPIEQARLDAGYLRREKEVCGQPTWQEDGHGNFKMTIALCGVCPKCRNIQALQLKEIVTRRLNGYAKLIHTEEGPRLETIAGVELVTFRVYTKKERIAWTRRIGGKEQFKCIPRCDNGIVSFEFIAIYTDHLRKFLSQPQFLDLAELSYDKMRKWVSPVAGYACSGLLWGCADELYKELKVKERYECDKDTPGAIAIDAWSIYTDTQTLPPTYDGPDAQIIEDVNAINEKRKDDFKAKIKAEGGSVSRVRRGKIYIAPDMFGEFLKEYNKGIRNLPVMPKRRN